MKKKNTYISLTQIAIFSLAVCLSSCENQKDALPEKQLLPFSLHNVRLSEGMFHHAMELNGEWLLSLDPDRMMSGFRLESGLPQKAPKYGGWESAGVAGQTFGHYLSGLSMAYAATGHEEFNNRINYCMQELQECQNAFGNGLLASFPRAKELFEEVARGDIRTKGFDLNEGWVPMYTMHKLFAGLIDVYNLTGNKQALSILTKLSDWIVATLGPLTDEQIQKILVAEHGGINESLANVYKIIGDSRYMDLSLRLNHRDILDPLAQGIDQLAGKHANTQIPKVIGTIRQYELTGHEACFHTADFFWNTVVDHHTYVIGGNSEAEHFGVPGRTYDRITDKTCETCNSYNMLKLTRDLFELTPDIHKVDYYERTLYNHIFASQNPENGMVCYMSPLNAGGKKEYSTPFDSFWCCVGTGLENHTKYGEFIYYTNKINDLYVNLFIPSELNWQQRGIRVNQQTGYPETDKINLKFEMEKEQSFTVNLRYPEWAKKGFIVTVNGETVSPVNRNVQPGNYIQIKRKWKNGDTITYHLPFSISSEEARGDSTLRAYLYGPVVLASILPENHSITPVVVSDSFMDAEAMIIPGWNDYSFILQTTQPEPVKMIPYYKTGSQPMMVYFNHYTEDQWEERKEFILLQQDQERWIQQQTVSHFRPGEMQPERDHNFKGENIETGDREDRKYRIAPNGGWFSFEMDVLPDQPMDLVCTYWGDLGDIYKFTIDVDGAEVSTVIIHWWGRKFIDKTYHIPANVTKGKEKVTVTFRALDNKSIAGPLFDAKILKS